MKGRVNSGCFDVSVSSSFEDNFNFSLEYTADCELSAMCTANQTLDLMSCEVSYGSDPTYQSFSQQVQEPLNQTFLLGTLEDETTYYIETVFRIRSSGVDVFYHFQRPFTTGQSECTASPVGVT